MGDISKDMQETIGERTLKVAVSLAFHFLSWLWSRLQKLAGKEIPGTCVALYYHAIRAEHRARFATQMDTLTRLTKPVAGGMTQPLPTGTRHATVMFHDAFESVCDNALPELARRRIPSTLFVPSGCLGKRQQWISDETHTDFSEVVLDADRLKALDGEFVAIGSHTVSHADLSVLSEKEAEKELTESKVNLELILGRPVELFAFPYGRCTEALAQLSKRKGYRRVFTIQQKLAFVNPEEFVTGSFMTSPTDWTLEFRLKLLGAYRWLAPVHQLKRRMLFALGSCSFRAKHDGRIPRKMCSLDAPVVENRTGRGTNPGASNPQQS